MMGIKLSELIRRLPRTRRTRIAARAQVLRDEIEGLRALRNATAKTQVEVARTLGVSQPSIARIERQADMYLSTLRSYIEAAGGKLALVVNFKDGHSVQLTGLTDMTRVTGRRGAVKSRAKESVRPRAPART